MRRDTKYVLRQLHFLATQFQKLVERQKAAGHLPEDWADPGLDTAVAVINHMQGEVPRVELVGNLPAIVYFRTEEDRQEFTAAVTLAKPDMAVINAPKSIRVSGT